MPDAAAPLQLVVIAAPAGAADAVGSVLAGLPADLPAAVVVAMPGSPAAARLPELLARRSALPVGTVQGRTPLLAGTVYLSPPGADLEIEDRHVLLGGGGAPDGPHAAGADVGALLASAAAAYGDGLAAVLLAGIGPEGAAGARAVKREGGTLVVELPAAPVPPAAAPAPDLADVAAEAGQIGGVLRRVLAGAHAPGIAGAEEALESLLARVHDRSGIDFSHYKRATILRRLQRRMTAADAFGLDQYAAYLDRHPGEYQRLVATFLVKATEFFRDREVYDHLRDGVLPEIVDRARHRDHVIRLWSAGCATGEEAYSLAILLAQALEGAAGRFRVRIFATDLDGEAVAFARRGAYPDSALAAVDPALVSRHFERQPGGYAVSQRIRSMIVFGRHDLATRPPFPALDLVLCRNVLIYFNSDLQKRALELFAFSLPSGGRLVLGKAETAAALPEYFEPEHAALRCYRRHGERIPTLPAGAGALREVQPRPSAAPSRGRAAAEHLPNPASALAAAGTGQMERLLLQAPVGVAVVDAHYDIRQINHMARRILGIGSAAVGDDLIHLSQGLPRADLQAVIDRAFAGGDPARRSAIEVADPVSGHPRHIDVLGCACAPPGGAAPDLALVLLADVTDHVRQRTRLEEDLAAARSEASRQAAQIRGLLRLNGALEAANRDLTEQNARLRSANEEFLTGSEEAQADSEEVETLNEELQATNEELETLNEELRTAVEELNTANEDIEARSAAAQDVAATSEALWRDTDRSRGRLAAILAGMTSAVVLVDHSGRPVMTNAAFDEAFGADPDALHLEDLEGHPLTGDAMPWHRTARAEPFRMDFVLIEPDGGRRWFEALAKPAGAQADPLDGRPPLDGTVVSIGDITDRTVRRLQDEFLAVASHELRSPLTALSLYTELLARLAQEASADSRVRRIVDMMVPQARRLRVLVQDLLDVGRLERGQLMLRRETVDLAPIVLAAGVAAKAMPNGEALRLNVPDGPVTVAGDKSRLEQVVTNLLDNALKYAGSAGPVDLRLRDAEGAAELEVADRGPGIPAEALPRVFDRFYRSDASQGGRAGGLGLGLYLVKKIVEGHGGAVEVSSAEGQGTAFRIRIPLAEPRAEEPR